MTNLCTEFINSNKDIKVIKTDDTPCAFTDNEEIESVFLKDYGKYSIEEKRKIGWIVEFSNIHQYKKCADVLKMDGLQYLKDYCPCFLFQKEVNHRKYVVFVGECQLEDVASLFHIRQRKYASCFIDARFIDNYNNAFLAHLIDCSTFVVRNNYSKIKKILNKYIIEKDKSINVPFFSFWGMWPQIEQKIEKKNMFNCFSCFDKGPFPVADVNINRSIINNEKIDEVVEKVMQGDYVRNLDMIEYYEKSERLFELMTYDDDEDLKKLFLNLVKSNNILRDPTHLQPFFINELVEMIVCKMECGLIEKNIDYSGCNKNPCTEMIVYPQVREVLKLDWYQDYKYAVREGLDKPLVYLCIEDWIRYYFDYCSFIYKKGGI